MVSIVPGTEYRLENFNKETGSQTVRFTTKGPDGKFIPGTTNEEVIDMMVDRMYELNKKRFSVENQCAIILLKSIRQLFAKRLSKKVDNVIKYEQENKPGYGGGEYDQI